MKLYYSKGACSLAVRILINELKLKASYESVDLRTKKTESGNHFLEINPKGAVPTLALEDGTILTENAVIHQYLADHYQAYQLLPAIVDLNRYNILTDLNFVTTELHKGFSPLFNPKIPQEIKDDIIIPGLMQKFNYVNSVLESHAYFSGDDFMLADGYLFVILFWAKHIFNMDFSGLPEIVRYQDMMKKRQSVETSLAQEGL